MVDFIGFIEKANNANTESELISIFKQQLSELGFDRVLYTLATDHKSIHAKAGYNVIENYPDDWMEHYHTKKYFDIDPVVHHAAITTTPFVWDRISGEIPLTREQRCLLNESKDAKLFNGMGLGIHCKNNEIAAFGFARSEKGPEESKTNISLIKLMANHFHATYLELRRKQCKIDNNPINTNLSRRQIEVLHWAAAGKNNPEIAMIMNIDCETVTYHFREIFKKLEVNDRTLAVVMAIKFGIIHP